MLQTDHVGADHRHGAGGDADLAGHAHEVRALRDALFTRGEPLAKGTLDRQGITVVASQPEGGLAALTRIARDGGLGDLAEIEAGGGGEAVEIRLAGEAANLGDQPGDRGDLARAHQEQPAEVGEREEIGEGLDGEGLEREIAELQRRLRARAARGGGERREDAAEETPPRAADRAHVT